MPNNMGFITPAYIANVIFTLIAFATFIKLVSNEVYLNYHRLLPCIGAVITIHDFYIIIIPFVNEQSHLLLYNLCDSCATVIIFMMFDYLVLIKQPKFYKTINTISVVIMVALCIHNFLTYQLEGGNSYVADILAFFIIIIGSLYVELISNSKRIFDREDKQAGYIMFSAFATALIGYLVQAFFATSTWILSLTFAINCIIYFYMASTNRIEDTAVIVSNAIFNSIQKPSAIVNSHFYLVDVNKAAIDSFRDGVNAEFAFEDGNYKNKFKLGQKMILTGDNDKEIQAGTDWFLVHWDKVESKKGVKGYIFTLTNVTDSHKEIQQAKAETKEKGQFLAQMSHELRSPLHAIIGVSDILLGKHDISTKNRGLIQHIKKASDGLLEVVDAILDYSKLDAGKFSFTEKKYNIQDMFQELAYNNIVNIQSKPVDFTMEIKTDYPKFLYGDNMRVREIFQNLLSNAVKYTDSGCVRCEIAFEEEDEEREHIFFKVIDTGRGMNEEQLATVFNEYVSDADGILLEGTGLGLTITKSLVELMGGSIRAESDGNTGSTFTGDIYQKRVESQTLGREVLNRRTIAGNAGVLDPDNIRAEWIYPEAKILIADDMRINQEILTQILRPWKCQVLCVSDGMKAVEAAKEYDFSLILLDQMMAPMSGLEAADEIRKFSEVPIVLVTANTEDNVHDLIEKHNINDFVGKPIHIQQIARVIDEYMPYELRQKNLETTITNSVKQPAGSAVYKKTLETFVREMEPLLLHLPTYAKNDRDMFKIKVHGIKGVSRQIGRETFADQAEIMEMASKAEHWSYIEKHLDEFLTSLCDVVEDVTLELTMLTPETTEPEEEIIEKPKKEVIDSDKVKVVFEDLLQAFDSFDIAKIEQQINIVENISLDKEQSKVFSKILDAYDTLEYEQGSEVLSAYLQKN